MIEAIRAGFGASLIWACAVALAIVAAMAAWGPLSRLLDSVRRRLGGGATAAMLAVVAAWAILYGGSKGHVTVSDPYITDAGSYLTNDIAHVSIAKRTPILPDETEILVYAREVSSEDPAEWVRLSPHLTLADHPYDYALPNATNYNVMVAASYVPAPSVHTNGVWQIKGFIIPGSGKAAFPNTKIRKAEQ